MGRVRQTQCARGHVFNESTLEEYTSPKGRKYRHCKVCRTAARKARYKPTYKRRTHCLRGHELTDDNVYAYVSKQGNHIRECKTCAKSKNDRRYAQLRENHLMRNYGITQAQYDALLSAQGGRCKVPTCRTTDPGGMGAFHIDHDHRCCSGKKCCGKCIRGLLCNRCNTVLGRVLDSTDILNGLIQYLESQPVLN